MFKYLCGHGCCIKFLLFTCLHNENATAMLVIFSFWDLYEN